MIVVDAGVWVQALIGKDQVGSAARAALTDPPDWVLPGHSPVEALRTIRRFEAARLVGAQAAAQAAAEVANAAVTFVGPEPWLLRAVWQLRHTVSPYDAPYVAIALQRQIPLVTFDVRLARAASGLGVEVIVPGGSSTTSDAE